MTAQIFSIHLLCNLIGDQCAAAAATDADSIIKIDMAGYEACL